MGISYEEAARAQLALEDKILADPNVVSIGVIAETNDLGEKTGDYVVKVGVISAEKYHNSVTHGDSVIPQEYVLQPEGTSGEFKSVRVKVVKTGQIKALSAPDNTVKNEFPSAVDDIPVVNTQVLGDQTSRRRPSPGGYSIGHPTATAGTFGILLEYEEGPSEGKAFILSNNHVIADNNLARVGDPIIQPGKHDSGIVGQDTIAFLHRWTPLNYHGINFVDAAIAEVKGGRDWAHYVMPYVSHIGFPTDLAEANLDMRVEKMGRTTGHTTGTVVSINQTVKVDYGRLGILTFKNQICTTSMSKSGDSGSCLFESSTKKPVGLLFAGDDSESFHNPVIEVLSSLSMPSVNTYPTGRTYRFSSDYPLKILKKRSYSTYALSYYPGKHVTLARSLVSLAPTRYRAALGAIGIGLYAATSPSQRIANFKSSQHSKNRSDAFLYKALVTCSFFRTFNSHARVSTRHPPVISSGPEQGKSIMSASR